MADFTLTVDGKAVAGAARFGVINPATGEVFAEAPDASRAQLDAAMESAQAAFRPWQADLGQRRRALRACAEAIKAKAAELAPILVREQGKPMTDAFGEVIGSAVWFEFTARRI
jgi:acyl-CoA reductase-like NAD-dependent aldehyde dehydrogenase